MEGGVLTVRVLEVFTHPGCLSRRCGMDLIREVLRLFPDISLAEVDCCKHTQRAESLGVKMSPTLVLDGKIVAVGVPDREVLKAILSQGREASHG